ncbi:hypothetical protein GCM10009679_18560 [Saccharothrix algeriensis]|uniref:Uncharacterized protein n=1 Tax=Catellatospora bangladeshensis TaxID=310355 RepID=A0A8J3NKK9_9ACTN|nr:hypothetical protein Cba03nite_29840 [Catellatospora bangladeshensis]
MPRTAPPAWGRDRVGAAAGAAVAVPPSPGRGALTRTGSFRRADPTLPRAAGRSHDDAAIVSAATTRVDLESDTCYRKG